MPFAYPNPTRPCPCCGDSMPSERDQCGDCDLEWQNPLTQVCLGCNTHFLTVEREAFTERERRLRSKLCENCR